MFAESSRLFSIACLVASRDEVFTAFDNWSQFEFNITFETLSRYFEPYLKTHSSVEAEHEPVYFLQASISYLKLISRTAESPSILITADRLAGLLQQTPELLPRTQALLIANFDMLPDPTPRGQHYEFCETLSRQIAEIASRGNEDRIEGLEMDEIETERSQDFVGPADYLDTVS